MYVDLVSICMLGLLLCTQCKMPVIGCRQESSADCNVSCIVTANT